MILHERNHNPESWLDSIVWPSGHELISMKCLVWVVTPRFRTSEMLTEGWLSGAILTRTLGILVPLRHFRRYVTDGLHLRTKEVALGANLLLGSSKKRTRCSLMTVDAGSTTPDIAFHKDPLGRADSPGEYKRGSRKTSRRGEKQGMGRTSAEEGQRY